MGAGASALPDKLSLEDAQKFTGEKFNINIFKEKCDADGFISRDVLLVYDKKEMHHANTMPSRINKSPVRGSHKLTQAESMNQLWKKATGLARPTSVKDIATSFMLAKRAAWVDPSTSSLLSPNNRRSTGIGGGGTNYFQSGMDALTPVTKHHKKQNFDMNTPIEESVTPDANHHQNKNTNFPQNDLPSPTELTRAGSSAELHHVKSVTSYDESMDSNDSLLLESNSRQELLALARKEEERRRKEKGEEEKDNNIEMFRAESIKALKRGLTLSSETDKTPSSSSEKPPEKKQTSPPPPATTGLSFNLRLNMGAPPLTLDLNAPPADKRGLTLMTDTVGTMKAAGGGGGNKIEPLMENSLEIRKFGSKRYSTVETKENTIKELKLDRADSFGDLLEGVDGIIKVDEGDESFMMTPRKSRGMTLNLETSTEQDKSMMFTESGAIELKGIDLPIRDTGMIMNDSVDDGHVTIDQQRGTADCFPVGRSQKLALQDRAVRLERLGQGAAGIVYKAFDLEGLELVALKEIPIYEKVKRHQMVHELNSLHRNLTSSNEQAAKLLSENGGAAAKRDSSVEDTIGSSHVVAFIDAFSNLKDATVNLMVEYMNGGSLQNIVDAGGCDDHTILANIAKQSLLGLRFLHRTNNLHRDIKPANMLINYEGEVKISDFGIIRKLEQEVEEEDDGMMDPGAKPRKKEDGASPLKGRQLKSAHTFVGTVTFMSPERIDGESYSTPSDIWSVGLSLMTCALGEIPLRTNKGYWSLLQCVRDEDPPSFDKDDDRWSDDFRDFCRLALIKDPSKRATCDDLLAHPFLKRADYLTHNSNNDNFQQHSCSNNNSMKGGEDEEKKDNDNDDSVAIKRARSNSAVQAQEEIGYVMREGGESELDAMLTACYYHFEELFNQNRQSCLLPLNKLAAEAATPLEALSIFLRKDAQPKRNNKSQNDLPCDCLSRLAGQLNLPLSCVRDRVDALSKEGISAVARKKRSSPGLSDSEQNLVGGPKRVLFDTWDSSNAIGGADPSK